ncbi:MAG: S1C family serine protease [Ruminococcus sp.]|jgi:serine protease Do|nr:S1C family serine protease [Ruminococcus sp.]
MNNDNRDDGQVTENGTPLKAAEEALQTETTIPETAPLPENKENAEMAESEKFPDPTITANPMTDDDVIGMVNENAPARTKAKQQEMFTPLSFETGRITAEDVRNEYLKQLAQDESAFFKPEISEMSVPLYGNNGSTKTPPDKIRRISNGKLVALLVFFLLTALLLMISFFYLSGREGAGEDFFDNSSDIAVTDNNAENRVNITLEQVERPEFPDENYIDRQSGKFSTTGIIEYVLPSTVIIKVFGESAISPEGYGSGVIMSANGYIITNAHVVDGGKQFAVQLYDGTTYEAEVIGSDSAADIAVVRIDAEGLTPASFGKTEDVKQGEQVAVIASSGIELNDSVTFGYVSNTARSFAGSSGYDNNYLQIDAAVNPGNSGGPVVNMYGQVVGIVSSKYIGNYTNSAPLVFESIGFAIQIDHAAETALSLIENGFGDKNVRLGIQYYIIDNYDAENYGLASGLMVETLDPDCDIYYSGIKYEDIITKINGKSVLTVDSINKSLEGYKPGDTVTITYVRLDVTGKLTEYETSCKLMPLTDYPSNESYNGAIPL